jgi:hypothetical protein
VAVTVGDSGRVARKTAAQGGSTARAVNSTDLARDRALSAAPKNGVTASRNSAPTLAADTLRRLDAINNQGPVIFNQRPHSSAVPYVLPSVLGVFGNTWARGTMVRNVNSLVTGPNYGFRFYYNPESINFSSPVAMNQTPAGEGGVQFPSLFNSLGTISFTVLLNRTEDIYARTIASQSVLGSTKLADLGTTHDMEILYRMINGRPRNPNGTADRGFIYPTPVNIRFSNALKGTFFLTDVSVNHIKFGATMAPMVSSLTLAATRFTDEDPGTIGRFPGDPGGVLGREYKMSVPGGSGGI